MEFHIASEKWREESGGCASGNSSLVPVDAPLWLRVGRRCRSLLCALRHATVAIREVNYNVSSRHCRLGNSHLSLSSGCSIYSEKFLVKVYKEGFSSYIGKANNSATLFTVRPHLFFPPLGAHQFAWDIQSRNLKGFYLILYFCFHPV